MFFNKLRGCSACHQSKPDVGGRSGPELYTAAARLQPDYIYSYMKHPQQIDPLVWMPDLSLSEPDAQRLTGYIMMLGETGSNPCTANLCVFRPEERRVGKEGVSTCR